MHRNESYHERYNFNFVVLAYAYIYVDSNQFYKASEIALFYLVPWYILNFILSEIFLKLDNNNVQKSLLGKVANSVQSPAFVLFHSHYFKNELFGFQPLRSGTN